MRRFRNQETSRALINRQEDFNGPATSRPNRFALHRILNGLISRDLHGDIVMRSGGSLSRLRRIGASA
jgi:hypothetical protein